MSSKSSPIITENRERYLVGGWGQPYFDVNDAGNISVSSASDAPKIDLKEVVDDLRERGLDLPLLLRFPDILAHRIDSLNRCFQSAIEEYDYQATYRGVFPIKVNQQRHLINEIVKAGAPWKYGLEAGSKPELLIALACMQDDGFIVCNGYKDASFIETALIAQKFDNTVVIVLERPDEVMTAIEASERLGIRPVLGVRAKLASRGMGRWVDSAGDRAKFGLTASQILRVVELLREHDMLDCLQMLHFHIGSQISSISPWKNALREAGQIYVELAKSGAPMGYLDVGGGLAVDYDGSQSDFHASMNYGIQEYANDVVAGIRDACNANDVPHPTIVSESGRAVASYQSILVFDAVGTSRDGLPPSPPAEDAPRVVREIWETLEGVKPKNVQESWHDACSALDEARSLFRFGYLGMRELADVEALFWAIWERVLEEIEVRKKRVPEELEDLEDLRRTIVYCNFSLFQSAPDVWAMDQLFPIMPIHRLDEEPTIRGWLADLTCDSDGMIKRFIDTDDVSPTLALHEPVEGEPYTLGMFLVGAYQEILGDLHNLFGDTHAVHIRIEDDGYVVEDVVKGDTVSEVMRYVQYDPEDMIERVRRQAERSLKAQRITRDQLRRFMRHYEDAMHGYTYLRHG